MRPALSFTVHGSPVGQGSKRHVGGGRMIEASKRLRPYRALVTDAALQAAGDGLTPFEGPVEVTVWIELQRPRSHYRTGRYATLPRPDAPYWYAVKTPDIDKVARALLDGMTDAGIWRDDKQVAVLSIGRMWMWDDIGDRVRVRVDGLRP